MFANDFTQSHDFKLLLAKRIHLQMSRNIKQAFDAAVVAVVVVVAFVFPRVVWTRFFD